MAGKKKGRESKAQQVRVEITVNPYPTGRTLLGVCLDRSGSMASVCDATISGFNEWLTDQKRLTQDEALLTMVKFDTEYEFPYVNTPLNQVQPLTYTTYQPRGGTALNDAIMRTTQMIDQAMRPGDRALVLILTDGEENSSKEFRDVQAVRTMIRGKESLGTWTFVFMRGSLDQQTGLRQAQAYGVQAMNVRVYTPDIVQTGATFAAASNSTMTYRSAKETATSNFFDNTGSSPSTT